MKNLYVYNDFFKIIIYTNTVEICIIFAWYYDFNIYKKWLSNLN